MSWLDLVPWLVGLVCLLLATLAHYLYWTRRFTVSMSYAAVESLPTPDGALIELYRLPGEIAPDTAPVLLVHGVGIDHRNNDMLPQLSLARHLRASGRDVWLLRLRSGGLSRVFGDRRKVRFPRMAEHDLPLGIQTVLARTARAELDYVGFSMGGMLLYAALAAGHVDQGWLRKVVILGSPARVGDHIPLRQLLARLPAALVPPLPLRLGSRLVAFAAEWFRTPIHHLVYNADNVARGVAGPSMMTIEDIPGALNGDFLSFIRRGVIYLDGIDVLAALGDVATPVLFFAGARDRLAPPDAVRLAYDAWGLRRPETTKRFVLLSSTEGAAADYGHGDLAIGVRADRDVFEPVERFLADG